MSLVLSVDNLIGINASLVRHVGDTQIDVETNLLLSSFNSCTTTNDTDPQECDEAEAMQGNAHIGKWSS